QRVNTRLQSMRQQPIVGLEKHEILTLTGAHPRIARGGDALIGLVKITNFGEASEHLARLIRRTIVYHNDLEVAIRLFAHALERFTDKVRVVVSRDDYGYFRH